MTAALRRLMAGIVDYAGLFPPAGLPLPRVVENFDAYLRSPERWMVGRLIIPLGKLASFSSEAERFVTDETHAAWRVSCLLPKAKSVGSLARKNLNEYWHEIEKFNSRHMKSITIDAVEIAVPEVGMIPLLSESLLASRVDRSLEMFVEIPSNEDCRRYFAALAAQPVSMRAKIRTGGDSRDLFPSSEAVAAFVMAATEAKVPFKATAGLHHPLRAEQPISYEEGCSRVVMHGFLNLAMAAATAQSGQLNENQLVTLLEEGVAEELQFSDVGASWRGVSVSLVDLERSRWDGLRSFGSCSFVEPYEDLQTFGYLPEETDEPIGKGI